MLLMKSGAVTELKSLGLILRERWEERRETVSKIIEHRKKSGVPLSDDPDGSNPLTPLGDYPFMPDLDRVKVAFRMLTLAEVRENQMRLAHLMRDKQTPDEEVESLARGLVLKREIVTKSLASVVGLEDEEGPFSFEAGNPEHIQLLEDNGLLDRLFDAAQYLHELTGEQRKNCGALQPLTSESSTATPVQNQCESSEAATEEEGSSTTREQSTKREHALNESSSGIPGSGESSSSTVPPGMLG